MKVFKFKKTVHLTYRVAYHSVKAMDLNMQGFNISSENLYIINSATTKKFKF